MAAIVGGTIGAVVLIPLLILCLFIFIRNRRDAKEYADFMKDKEKARWDAVCTFVILLDLLIDLLNPPMGMSKITTWMGNRGAVTAPPRFSWPLGR